MKQLRHGLIAAVVCLATVTTGGTAASAVLPPPNTFKVSTGGLVLTPQPGGGYLGVLTITATYTGVQPSVSSPAVTLLAPANFGLTQFNGFGTCVIDTNGAQRCRASNTYVRRVPQTVSIGFIGFAAPADYARLATGGWVRFSVDNEPSGRQGTAGIRGIMAAADGSISDPVRYTPAPAPDMGFTASSIVAADGVLTIDVTVRNHNDAYNFGAAVFTGVEGLPLSFISVTPPTMCLFPWCSVPGDTLFEGNERKMQLKWGYSGAPGTYTGAVTLQPSNATPADINPADNTLPITITIP